MSDAEFRVLLIRLIMYLIRNRIASIIQLGRKNCKIIEKQGKTTMQPRKSFGPKIAQRKRDTKSKDQSFFKNL